MKSVLITGGRIIDGNNPDPVEDSVLYVKGGKIEKIADQGERFSSDTERIDVSGMTIMPSLIDSHLHLAFSASVTPEMSTARRAVNRFTALPSSYALGAYVNGVARACTHTFGDQDNIRTGRESANHEPLPYP